MAGVGAVDGYEVYTTFLASIRSVGTACTLAAIGIYLHRRNFIVGEGKRTLALISQQVTIPLFLFTKIVYCNQDWSDAPCPDITKNLSDIWILLLWPIYVVACGLAVGYIAAKMSNTPKKHVNAVLATCAFANSTGLPITLLTVVHANFPSTTDLGHIDPTLFLSVYLLMYPVLQWGVGGWLLAPTTDKDDDGDDVDDDEEGAEDKQIESGAGGTKEGHYQDTLHMRSNVLNNKEMANWYKHSRRGMSETDASLYISENDLLSFAIQHENDDNDSGDKAEGTAGDVPVDDKESTLSSLPNQPVTSTNGNQKQHQQQHIWNTGTRLSYMGAADQSKENKPFHITENTSLLPHNEEPTDRSIATTADSEFEAASFLDVAKEILTRCLQPPVVGAMMGLFVAAFPMIRGIFVDIVTRNSSAPLQFMFDGLYSVGLAAVPLNMMILGCNLSAASMAKPNSSKMLSWRTMVAIVVGKMLVMPCIGIVTALALWDILNIPDEIDGSFWLVAMIVFITPTANNVMVMVELSGSGSREGIAMVIAWQYIAAPIVLSLTMSSVVGIASQWS